MQVRLSMRLVPVLVFAVAWHATAQSPEMRRADSAFQRKEWAAAASQYGSIARADAANGLAWFRLGASLESQRDFQGAASAYQRAASLKFQPLASELRLARTYAQASDAQRALAHLRTAATFGFPSALVANEPALEPLRQLPEYAVIVKAAEDVRYPCRNQHTFDFWEGVFQSTPWDQPNAPARGTLTNSRLYEGCTFVEKWDGGASSQGMSIVFYDTNRQKWRMIWNDDQNSSNDMEGEYRDGAMRFQGWVLSGTGERILISNVLENVTPDVIHHIFSTSTDNGKTWNVQSDGRFTRQR